MWIVHFENLDKKTFWIFMGVEYIFRTSGLTLRRLGVVILAQRIRRELLLYYIIINNYFHVMGIINLGRKSYYNNGKLYFLLNTLLVLE